MADGEEHLSRFHRFEIKQLRAECSLNTTHPVNVPRCVTKIVVRDTLCKHSSPRWTRIRGETAITDSRRDSGTWLTSQWERRRTTSLSKAVIATEAAMTRAKRDGNDRDFCAAIRVKRKLFKLRAFTVDLQAPISLSLSSSLFRPPSSIHSSFFFRPSSPSDSHPLPPTLSLFKRIRLLYRFCFFSSLPHCIQNGSTKLETAALSALLRLLLSAVPVSSCLLSFVAFLSLAFTSALFCSYSVGGPLLLRPSREGLPWRREDRSPLQLTLGPDLLNVLLQKQPYLHNWIYNRGRSSLKLHPLTKYHFFRDVRGCPRKTDVAKRLE